MLLNYLKIAWRNLIRNKVYSSINILGLSAGLAVAIIIGLWVYYEYSYDKFLPGYENVYQVRRNYNSNGELLNFSTTSLKLSDVLRDVPEIEKVVATDWMGSHGLKVGEKKLYLNGAIAENGFLDIFQYQVAEGQRNTMLKEPFSIVLTESTAHALFGTEPAMHKTIWFDNSHDLTVTGIIKDLPANSTFQFTYIVPLSYLEATRDGMDRARESFRNNSWQEFVQLKPGIPLSQVAPKIRYLTRSEKDNINAQNSEVILQPMGRWHLFSTYINGKDLGGFIDYIRMFSIIAFLVLVIACINFINLTTARSEKRAREVGVRKTIGSRRIDLIIQFLMESFMQTSIAFFMAIFLVQLLLPTFSQFAGKQVSIPYDNFYFWLIMLAGILLTAIASGSRPAFYLSSFQPVKVLKGNRQPGSVAALPRKILVVIQFSCSIALIISTIIIYQQIQYVKKRPTGFDMNRLMMTDINNDLEKNMTALKNELLQKGIAASVTSSSSPATNLYWHSNVEEWPGKNAGETIEMATIIINEDYFKTMGMGIKEGRDFASAYDSTSVAFNEAAIQQMRIKDPIGKQINWQGRVLTISAVLNNALISSPFNAAEPSMFLMSNSPQGNLLYRLSPNIQTADALDQLTKIFSRFNPSLPYQYTFADASYANKFNIEMLIGKLAGIFAGLAILISCLGLFGLAAYIAEQRTKEIGIRKVLGASVAQLWMLLSKDFILLVLIGAVLAIPVAFYFLQNWLNSYDYRISIGPGVFLVAGAMALMITLITVSFQSVRAALANPVNSLKND